MSQPGTHHRYLITHGDPINFADPSGRDEEADEEALLSQEVDDAIENLKSIKKFQNKYRKGADVSCIIDDTTGSEDYVDYLLKQVTCLDDLEDLGLD